MEHTVELRIIRVASRSDARSTAKAIVHFVREEGGVAVRAVSASAVNQAVKAIAIARDYWKDADLICRPSFSMTDDIIQPTSTGERTVTCLVFEVIPGPRSIPGAV